MVKQICLPYCRVLYFWFNFIPIHQKLHQSKFWLFYFISYYSVLFYSVLFVIFTLGTSSREVEYQISNPKVVSSIPTMVTMALTLLFFYWGKPPEISEKPPEISGNLRKTSGKPPENSEDGGKLRKCKCIYAAHKQETFSAPWTVWSCGIRLYVRKSTSGVLTVYDFATAPLWISLFMRKILFYFLSV